MNFIHILYVCTYTYVDVHGALVWWVLARLPYICTKTPDMCI